MCGIAGAFSLNADLARWRHVAQMTAAVTHRGPDGEGHLLFDLQSGLTDLHHGPLLPSSQPSAAYVYLGHRRLSILDLSPAGAQPMASEDASLFLTFNGEVYNYIEIREELTALGHRFHTGTDTEVVLHAYREWGDDCFSRFNGMWALAILDVRARRLVLCLDRFGVKPLHYLSQPGFFAFGSEIKQLLPLLDVKQANETAVAAFIATGVTHHGASTCFEGILRMTPGELITLDLSTGQHTSRQWYTLPFNPDYGADDEAEFRRATARFRELVESAIVLRMRSDVPVGSCLSGGLDSSAVVGVASRLARSQGAGPLHTFTSCWDDATIDEWSFARTVVEANGCIASRVFPTWERFQADLNRLLWHQEEPFAGASMFAQWTVMSLAREKGIPVLLDGQGSDEMLGGYHGDLPLHLRDAILASPVKGVRKALAMRAAGYRYGLSALLRAIPFASETLYRHRIRREGGQPNGLGHVPANLGASLHQEYTGGTLQTLLRYEDRSSMAFSIESRCPFMDYRLAEFVFSLPRSMLSHGAVLKPLLRSAMGDVLPPAVAGRIGKLGFAAPAFSIHGPAPIYIGGRLRWRRQIVERWRGRFGLPERSGPLASWGQPAQRT